MNIIFRVWRFNSWKYFIASIVYWRSSATRKINLKINAWTCLFSRIIPSFHVTRLQTFDPYEINFLRSYTLPACLNIALKVSISGVLLSEKYLIYRRFLQETLTFRCILLFVSYSLQICFFSLFHPFRSYRFPMIKLRAKLTD